jgi:tRNA-Thr(GGU) m(6)t(6)A37 methyltransferase TsaA
MKIIAHIETDLPEKFGIPRQSGLAGHLKGRIVFEPEYRRMEAFKGLEEFNYIWLLWQFEGTERQEWSPTVRPPRLGGNTRIGVFATRSPFRPNNIGLSSVKLDGIQMTDRGPVLDVSGIDLRNGTPIYDIKPYLRYADSHPDAIDGFAQAGQSHRLDVDFPSELLSELPEEKRTSALEILSLDPRPAYHNDPDRRYGVSFAGFDIRFSVNGHQLTVHELIRS